MLNVTALCTEYRGQNGAIVKAAQDVTFNVPEGKFFTLLGPSGCGKTTTLRSIAGLERPVSGDIIVGDKVVYSSKRNVFLPPNERNFGMVFQSYAIWPHMNVFRNVSFPLEVRKNKPSQTEIRDRVMRVLEAVALDHLAEREATKLSGGQQQRLALARALVMEPKLLLLDEPLSNLDAKLREKMRFELKRMQDKFKLTTIYVTHDQSEALALSDEIAVMNEGRIVQMATPRDIYERPRTKFVADFIGTTNFLDGTVVGKDGGQDYWDVRTSIGVLKVKSDHALQENAAISISVRPEDVHLSETAPGGPAQNAVMGIVDQAVFLGEYMDLKVRLGEYEMLARAHPTLRASAGGSIHLRLDPEKCVAVAPQ
ncbi:MAG: ABC transporter ATP-binding protein [Beijerinckiaceae bacterium]|nr:ABC transporter ATP-binding protein [Beijerinckiaceae bacterium]